jgi:tetratricopeptide (TPR) repeat protein
VFTKGNHLFPHSGRMLIGLGVAKYARGFNDEAALRLCEASDLNPQDPDPYLFLGEMEIRENAHSGCRVEKLQRFARLQPNNALANYYSALTVDRVAGTPDSSRNLAQIQRLLEKAVAIDPTLSAGYFQLGVLYSDQKNFASAIPALQKAIQSNPGLAEAHFRLARAYASTGEPAKAQSEMEVYRQTSKKATEQADRERRHIRQFVFILRDQPPASQPAAPAR